MKFTNWKVTTEPAIDPINWDEAKTHMRLLDDGEQAYVEALILAARQYAEEFTDRSFITRDMELYLEYFPIAARSDYCSYRGAIWSSVGGAIKVPRPPLISVTSIKYFDNDGVEQTLAPTEYTVNDSLQVPEIVPAYGKSWPSARLMPKSVTVAYKAGYGADEASVPQAIKHALLLLVAHWYENREPVSIGNAVNEIPHTTEALLWPYRVF